MKENYDFSKGVKNPYAQKLKDGYAVTVRYDFTSPATDENKQDENAVDENRTQKQA